MKKFLTAILIFALLIACSFTTPQTPQAAQAPTSTPRPTDTPRPTSTASPTATPTLTPVPASPTQNKTLLNVEQGRFSVLVPENLKVDYADNAISVSDESGALTISFEGNSYDHTKYTLNQIINQRVDELAAQGGRLDQGASATITVDGKQGVAIDLSGNLFAQTLKGRAIAVSPSEDFVIFGLGLFKSTANGETWETYGGAIFEDLLKSMQFNELQGTGCEVSTDPAYGYAKGNPIQVGGGVFDGPAREHDYLDTLRGPHGEELSYTRNGSLMVNDTILDEYAVKGPGIKATLYIDEYVFNSPKAPVGFTCAGPFPFKAT